MPSRSVPSSGVITPMSMNTTPSLGTSNPAWSSVHTVAPPDDAANRSSWMSCVPVTGVPVVDSRATNAIVPGAVSMPDACAVAVAATSAIRVIASFMAPPSVRLRSRSIRR